MLKVASFDIVFQEIPGEVTLALNLSNCPCHCPGCHSPHLAEDIGEELNEELLTDLTGRYKGLITCVAFMGGDAAPEEVAQWAEFVRPLRTAWYSGRMNMPANERAFDYVKLGPYVESLGGLKSEKTNQRLYKRVGGNWEDITSVFWKKTL
ncbi:MAG: 4Fe-4S cluster-binding domain-containing protein [Paludibacteraceae bacterium]|nr:4Fe-4S cluster-binding domain-containing protein [Paludibacteraceae bacterium]